VVRAWGADLSSHLVEYGFLSSFADVEAIVYTTSWPIADSENSLPIWRAAMDTGGGATADEVLSRTDEIYDFLTDMRIKYGDRGVYGVKGSSRPQFQNVGAEKEIDRHKPRADGRRRYRGLLTLRQVDTFELKKRLHWRLSRLDERTDSEGNRLPADSHRFYLHADTGMDYARQLSAEELRKDRRGKYYWKQIRRDNHYLDCEVYAAACADVSWQPNLKTMAAINPRRRPALTQPRGPATAPITETDPRPGDDAGWIASRHQSSWINRN
jgi:phage terminase large subunit GpA-like protein